MTNDSTPRDVTGRPQVQPPARRPCRTCPYRQDVPSGVWDRSEYDKLPRYDRPTPYQPASIFVCHLTEGNGKLHRVCAGWAGCHDGDELLALRISVSTSVRVISPETHRLTVLYESPVPLFASGAEAAAHGLRDLEDPSEGARSAIDKILRARPDIIVPGRRRRRHIEPAKDEL